jgi:PhzF family phenazine biosynthesis protein
MELYIVDSFTDKLFSGNQAGVVLLGNSDMFPEASVMQRIAAELKHSETAFVKLTAPDTYRLRYFTPEGEVELCGHATVSAFTVLRNEKALPIGNYIADTAAGRLNVSVEMNQVWMEMAQARLIRYLTAEESGQVYKAYGLDIEDKPENLQPCIVCCGLADILLPVSSKAALYKASQNRDEVIRISREQQVVGVHMYYCSLSLEATAYCRNFAPLYGIDEEAATGTSNASLTYYLYENKLISEGDTNVFLQGKNSVKSVIYSKTVKGKIYIGGSAVVSISGNIRL